MHRMRRSHETPLQTDKPNENYAAMATLHEIELNWIVSLQGDGGLKRVMEWCSYIGWEALPYGVAFVYFCASRRAGGRLFVLFPLSMCLLVSMKMAFHLPRPYWLDSGVQALSASGNYGMPSGHVLATCVVWLFVAKLFNRAWAWPLAACVVLSVSISRMYLGVHFISDVVAAWGIAAILLWTSQWLEKPVAEWLKGMNLCWQFAAVLWATACLLAIGFGVQWAIAGIADPPEWSKFSRNARGLGGLFNSAGEFFGAACGLILAARWARFEVSARWWKRGAALLYALAGAWLIRELADMLRRPQGETFGFSFDFLRGAVLNAWMVFAAPWILLRTGVWEYGDTTGTDSVAPPLIIESPRGQAG